MRSIDLLLRGHPLPPSLARRRDGRTPGQFALHVRDTTARERFLVREWARLVASRDLTIADLGVGNDGRLLLDPANTGSPDYRVSSPRGTWALEVKFGPTRRFVTYKVADLFNYIDRDALLLTVLGPARMVGPNGDPHRDDPLAIPPGLGWSLMGPEAMRRFLEAAEHGTHKGFGGKPTARLHAGDFRGVLRLREWRSVRRRVPA